MNVDIPWAIVALALLCVAAVFLLAKSFKMPSSFKHNQQQRDEIKKKVNPTPFSSTPTPPPEEPKTK